MTSDQLARRIDMIVLSILLVTIMFYYFQIFGLNTRFPGDLGDARFNQFVLEHVTRWFSGKETSLVSPAIFYPYPDALFFSDTHLGTALVYACARFLGAGRETAFNIWIFFGQFGSFLASLVVLRRWNMPLREASIAAFVFAYGLPVLGQLGHAQLAFRMAVPFAFDAFFNWWSRRSGRTSLALLIIIIVQLILSLYIGLFLILVLALFYSVLRIMAANGKTVTFDWSPHKASNEKRPSLPLLLSFILLSTLFAWMMTHYVLASSQYNFGRGWEEILPMVPRPASFLLADASPLWSWLGRDFVFASDRVEHQLFPGAAVAILLGLACVVRPQNQSRRAVQIAFILIIVSAFLLTINIGSITLYRIIAQLGGYNSLRGITRIYLVLGFPVAVLCAIALVEFRQHQKKLSNFLPIVMALILASETLTFNYLVTPITEAQDRIADLKADLADDLKQQFPIALMSGWTRHEPFWMTALDVMLVSQDLGIKSISGYSGNYPPGYKIISSCDEARSYLGNLKSLSGIEQFIDLSRIPNLKIVIVPAQVCPKTYDFP